MKRGNPTKPNRPSDKEEGAEKPMPPFMKGGKKKGSKKSC